MICAVLWISEFPKVPMLKAWSSASGATAGSHHKGANFISGSSEEFMQTALGGGAWLEEGHWGWACEGSILPTDLFSSQFPECHEVSRLLHHSPQPPCFCLASVLKQWSQLTVSDPLKPQANENLFLWVSQASVTVMERWPTLPGSCPCPACPASGCEHL